MGITISLCMIVKNEEKNLEACLESAKAIADEINIVDTGSTDRTVEIAKRYTDRIFYFEWVNDFSKARNFSFSKATKDYILWLDADDTITPENMEKILKLKETLTDDIKCVYMLYHYTHSKDGRVTTVLRRERLLKRSEGFKWQGCVHETITVSGKSVETDIFITHNHTDKDFTASKKRNLELAENTIKSGNGDERMLAEYAVLLYSFGREDEALEYMERVIALPSYRGILSKLTEICLCAHEIYLKRGDYDAALKVLTDNEDVMSDKSEFYCRIGFFFYSHEKNVLKAIECFKIALGCKGREANGILVKRDELYYYYEPLRLLASCYNELKRYGEALFYYKKMLEYTSGNKSLTLEVCSIMHAIYLAKGDDEGALKMLLDNKETLGGKSEYHCMLGAFYNYKEDTLNALESFLNALSCVKENEQAEPNEYYYFEPLRSVGNCLIKLGQRSEALKYYKMALEYKPGDEETLRIINKLERLAELEKQSE